MPSERTSNGRFVKGNPGGPGRPPKSQRLKDYGRAIREAVPPRLLAKMIRRLAKRALTGPVDANTVRCANVVLRACMGNDPACVIDLFQRLEDLEADCEERQPGTPPTWEPRHLTPEDTGDGTVEDTGDATRNGTHSDGTDDTTDDWLHAPAGGTNADGSGGVGDGGDLPPGWRLF